jgi:hypothetical protein
MSNETATALHVQSVADPAPLGLGAFGLTTFLSAVNAGWIPKPGEPRRIRLGLRLRRLGAVVCRHVGVQAKQYVWSDCVYFVRRLLDRVCASGQLPCGEDPGCRGARGSGHILAWVGHPLGIHEDRSNNSQPARAGCICAFNYYVLRPCNREFCLAAGYRGIGWVPWALDCDRRLVRFGD